MGDMPAVVANNQQLITNIANQFSGAPNIANATIQVNGKDVVPSPALTTSHAIASFIFETLKASNGSVTVTIGDQSFVFAKDGTKVPIENTKTVAGQTTTFDYDNMLRDQLKITTNPTDSRETEALQTFEKVHSNVSQPTQDELAISWMPKNEAIPPTKAEILKYQSSDEYKIRLGLLVLAIGTTGVNSLLTPKSGCPQPADVLIGVDAALDTLMKEIEDSTGLFKSREEELADIQKAWGKFVENMSGKPWVVEKGWGKAKATIMQIPPKFLVAFMEEVHTKPNENVGAWVINTIYQNGVANMPGIPNGIEPGGYKGEEFSNALTSFVGFLNQGGQEQDIEFVSPKQIDDKQNIFGKNASNAFWQQHASLRKYYAAKYPNTDNQFLMNMFFKDMRLAGIIKIDDLSESTIADLFDFVFTSEASKRLVALAHATANAVEATYGKGNNKELNIELKDSDIFTESFVIKLNAVKEQKAIPKITAKDVLESFKGSYANLGSTTEDQIKKLMERYYGEDVLPDNKFFSPTNGDNLSEVARIVKAGLEHLRVSETSKTSAQLITSLQDRKAIDDFLSKHTNYSYVNNKLVVIGQMTNDELTALKAIFTEDHATLESFTQQQDAALMAAMQGAATKPTTGAGATGANPYAGLPPEARALLQARGGGAPQGPGSPVL